MAQQKKKTFIVVVVVVAVLLLVGFLAKQSSVTDRGGDGAHSGHEPAAQATPAEKNATASEAPLAGKKDEASDAADHSAEVEATPTAVAEAEVREALKTPAIIVKGRVFMPDKSRAKNAPVILRKHLSLYPTGYGGAGQPHQLVISTLDSTMTDDQGRYELGAKETEALVLEASAQDTATESLRVDFQVWPVVRRKDGVLVVTVDVHLKPSEVMGGIVVGEEGGPIGGVKISLFQPNGFWGSRQVAASARHETVSGDDGKYSFSQFSKREGLIRALKDGYTPFNGSWEELGEDGKIVLRKNGGVVAGRVLMMGTDAPVEHASVQLFERLPPNQGSMNSFMMTAESGPDGSFRIGNVPPGNYMMVASAGRLQMASSNTGTIPDFSIADNETRDDFVLHLGKGTTIRGKVTDGTTHQPIAGAVVRSTGELDSASPPTATTNEKGEFVLEDVYGGRNYSGGREVILTATKEGYAQELSRSPSEKILPLALGQAEATCEIELFRTVAVSGRVMTPQNAPVVGARVTINSYQCPGVMEPTDPLGRFSIPMIANRASQLRVDADDFAITYSKVFELKDEPVKDLVIFVDPGATVIAKVVDPDGKVVAGADAYFMVRTFGENWSSAMFYERIETNNGGIATFRRVPTADYPLSMEVKSIKPALGATKDGYTDSAEVKPELHSNETTEVTITLRGKMKNFAAGFVRDGDGNPLQGVQLQCYKDDISVSATSAADGSFRLEGLSEPPYSIQLFHSEYGSQHETVDEADRSDLNFVMGKNQAILTCVAIDADTKEPIADAQCVRSIDGVPLSDITQPLPVAGMPGTFSMMRAPTGVEHKMKISATGYEAVEKSITIPEGEKEFIEVFELKKM